MHALVIPLLVASVANARRTADPEPPPAPVATGSGWHCAVQDGQLGCWGAPAADLPGDPRGTLGSPIALDGVQRVAAGPDHACAVASGRIACWGDNGHGQLGDGTTSARDEPVFLDTIAGAIDVSAGSEHTCAVTADGRVWCWGENGSGQLGTSSWADSPTPVRVPGVARVTSVRAGRDFTCALRADGTVACWGADITGAGGPGTIRTLPATVPGLAEVVALDAGFGQACAVARGGAVTCWGRVGGRATGPTPVDVAQAVGVTVGYDHACALGADGTAACWGVGEFGRLGDGTCTDSAAPVPVKGLAGASAIDASWTHTCAAVDDGLWCWGGNWTGEIPLQGKPRPCDPSFAEPVEMGAK